MIRLTKRTLSQIIIQTSLLPFSSHLINIIKNINKVSTLEETGFLYLIIIVCVCVCVRACVRACVCVCVCVCCISCVVTLELLSTLHVLAFFKFYIFNKKFFIADNIFILMYIMCVILCLFSGLSRRVGALQISVIIIYVHAFLNKAL